MQAPLEIHGFDTKTTNNDGKQLFLILNQPNLGLKYWCWYSQFQILQNSEGKTNTECRIVVEFFCHYLDSKSCGCVPSVTYFSLSMNLILSPLMQGLGRFSTTVKQAGLLVSLSPSPSSLKMTVQAQSLSLSYICCKIYTD